MIKWFKITFANGDPITEEYFVSLNYAVLNANRNLNYRHNVILDGEFLGNYVLLYIQIPNEKEDQFNVPMHLKGIANYCLKNYGNLYETKKVGTRLFLYKEVHDDKDI